MRKLTKYRTLLLAGLLLPTFLLAACDDEGPAEQLGRQVDEAAEELGGAVEDAGDAAKDAAEKIGRPND